MHHTTPDSRSPNNHNHTHQRNGLIIIIISTEPNRRYA